MSAALVTGGTRGIGLGIAKRLHRDGYKIGLLYREDEAAARAAADALPGAVVMRADVADIEVTTATATALEQKLGERFTVLVNNAGHTHDGLLMMQKWDDIERLLAVHLHAAIALSRHLLKGMIAEKKGTIVNIISPSAFIGRAGQSVYAAAKGGLWAFTRTLAQEVGRFGIRVNAVSPGLIDTDLLRSLPDALQNELLGQVLLGRLGTTEEVAAAVALLIRVSYMTGALISVDGGLTA